MKGATEIGTSAIAVNGDNPAPEFMEVAFPILTIIAQVVVLFGNRRKWGEPSPLF